VPQARSLPKLDPKEHGLVPVECEIWMGFVFVRFQKGSQPAVAELMAGHAEEVARYQPQGAKPLSPMTSHIMAVNWKSVRDVDNEGYHVPIAHPGLQDLYGNNYRDEFTGFGVSRSVGNFNETNDKLWSVRLYKKVLPKMPKLSDEQQSSWFYYGIFPNIVIMFYPDLIGFYQDIPLSVGRTAQRFGYYALPDGRRETNASRYLAKRIDRDTGAEDTKLIEWSYEAMQSSAYRGTILSDLEHGVSEFHGMLRQFLPVAGLAVPPANMQEVNGELRSGLPDIVWGH
jgi:phenylpropionate dioxygenase-like ring-hydroxylating dioxygenase large terminal subunit